MLILKRNVSQKIILLVPGANGGEEQRIEVMLVETRPGSARLGIECDKSIQILREELEEGWVRKERHAKDRHVK